MNQIFSYDKWAYQLLKQCSNKKDLKEWNEYRKQHNNAYVNLKFSNLENFYLVGANLENVDLRGATLDFANMKNTNIKKTNISKI